jgi:RNA polymerase sigma-70 factor (ECF subfamily)
VFKTFFPFPSEENAPLVRYSVSAMETDDERMAKAAAGDVAAFGRLVRERQGLLIGFAARMLGGDVSGGEDLAQEAFLRLWSQRDGWRAEGKTQAFLLRAVHHLCLDRLRRRARLAPLESAPESIAPGADPALALAVRDAIAALPATHRAVFVLSVYDGLSHAEIAEALCLPPGTVASRKHHAVRMLRETLKDWWDD